MTVTRAACRSDKRSFEIQVCVEFINCFTESYQVVEPRAFFPEFKRPFIEYCLKCPFLIDKRIVSMKDPIVHILNLQR
jgi:hypothetical protein